MGDDGAPRAVGNLVERAVELARRWAAEAAEAEVDPAAARLAGVLQERDGLAFTIGFVDGVMRPESLSAAAAQLRRVAPLAPAFLPWHLRAAVRAGGLVAPAAPFAVVPAARAALRRMVGHLIVDARPDRLGAALAKLHDKDARLNLNLLGEAVLGEREARRRLEGIHDLVRRPDVDYVSVKVSAVASRLSMWAFDETVDAVAERLLPLYLSAKKNGTFLNLDMEEYRDLHLTVAVFQRILDDPRLHGYGAGIVLQAYLPDALPALDRLTEWAQARVDGDGAPIRVRLVKGANLAMEHAEAALRGWDAATYDAKLDTDANYVRCLRAAFDSDRTRAVRIGVAGHNLFHIAYAWLLAGERGVRDGIGFEMLLGMAEGQMRAVADEVGRVLLYVPVVHPDEFDVAISYLVRRLEESASEADFLSAAFSLHDDAAMFAREENRFRGAVHRADDPALEIGPRRAQARRAQPPAGGDAAEREEPAEDLAPGEGADDPAGADEAPPVDGADDAEAEALRPEAQGAEPAETAEDARANPRLEAAVEPAKAEFAADAAGSGEVFVRGDESEEAGAPAEIEQDRAGADDVDRSPAGGDEATPSGGADPGDEEDASGSTDSLGVLVHSDDDGWVETAVFSRQETVRAAGAPGFRNTPDTDPSLVTNREWIRGILDRIEDSTLGNETIAAARIDGPSALDAVIARARTAGEVWGATPAAERAALLRRAARELESRRADLIEVAASETGKVVAEADTEVSEAVDFANYYAATAGELDRVPGALFVPNALTVVSPPWNFPLAIPAGGVLAALAAGSAVILSPAPQARRSSAVVAEALWAAGVPRDLLALVDIDEDALGQHLVTHPGVDRVLLTGSWQTAALFRSWRPDLPLQAETSGKNAIVVAPSADLDLAAADLVRSAFGHAGQKCSAASLAILVGPVGRSKRFARQLVDAARSLRVGFPSDPVAEVGPLIEPPSGKLTWALTELDEGESWLLEPRPVEGDETGRLWTPGIRIGVRPGSRFHREEFFGPVLGIMHAATLEEAVEMQNAVEYGLTAGLHTLDADDLDTWLETVQAGNLYVNRGITGAIVQRQPFGGWKRSSVGEGAKAGGPNHLVGLGSWRPTSRAVPVSTAQLRGLDSRIAALLEAAQPSLAYDELETLRRAALSDASAWDREFGRVKDASQLGVERNLFRYRAASVAVRAVEGAAWTDTLRIVLAGVRAADWFSLSVPTGLPAAVRRALGELDVPVFVESDGEWIERMAAGVFEPDVDENADATSEQILGIRRERPARARLVGPPEAVARVRRALGDATGGDPDLAVYAGQVTTSGRLELLPFLREQAISITAHRFGSPDTMSADVI